MLIQWLLDGSALLVGTLLFTPTTGTFTALPVTPETVLAVGTHGRIAALDLPSEGIPAVRILGEGSNGSAIPLPGASTSEGAWVHMLTDTSVYVHVMHRETGEARCWRVSGSSASALTSCLEGTFAQLDQLMPGVERQVVLASHGEGHPGVALLRPKGDTMEEVALPWQDLYPFGPLELLPRQDGSFDILTPCPLGPARPCLLPESKDVSTLPMRHYRWKPGEAPVLKAKGKAATRSLDPSSPRSARLKGKQLCITSPGKKEACWELPRATSDQPTAQTPAPKPLERQTLLLDPAALTWDTRTGTLTFAPGSRVMSAHYTTYILDASSLETLLGGRPTAPVRVVIEVTSSETVRDVPSDPMLPSPQGGFVRTTLHGRALSIVP